jgi:hypothetical protein
MHLQIDEALLMGCRDIDEAACNEQAAVQVQHAPPNPTKQAETAARSASMA